MMPTLRSKNARFAPKTVSLFNQWNAMLLLLFMMLSGGMFGQYSYTFTGQIYNNSNETKTLSSVNWLLVNNGGYYGYDGNSSDKGQQIGSSGNPASTMSLSTSGITGTITSIKITTSGASSVTANVSCTVGGSAFGGAAQSISSTSQEYTFNGSSSGAISINWAQSSSKALYFKKIVVTYSAGSTVTFNGNGSTGGSMANQTATMATNLTANSFTRTNYTFAGWNTAINGSGTAYANNASYPFVANATLYAQWTPNYTITFANLQFPSSGSIPEGGTFDVYGQVYAAGLTDAGDDTVAPAGITAEFGYSTTDNDPNSTTGWTWVPATFNTQLGDNDEYKATFSGLAVGTYYYATRFRFGAEPWVYGGYHDNDTSPTAGGIWNGVTNISGTLNVVSNVVDFANLELPYSGTITQGADFNANAKVYKAGFTEPAGASTSINAWIGISTTNATTSDFSSGWTWIPATFISQVGNDDIYTANIAGASRPAGTYYYVSRFQVIGSSEYKYGGTNNNFWNAPGNSGVLTITAPTVAATPGTLNSFTYVYGSGPSTVQNFTVSGSYLTANLEVTAPTNYEISTNSSSGFTSALSFTPASGTVASTPIYVRLKGNLPVATYNQSVSISSTAATTATVALTGSVTKKALTVSGAMAQNKPYDATTTATITGATLVGVIAPDEVSIAGGGTFATANVGTGIAVTANLTLNGANAGNYSLTQPTGLTANITAIAPTFTTLPINLTIGGVYALAGSNITSTSTGALSYSITSGGKATLSGTTLTGVAAGSETLTVNQAAIGNYLAGSTTVMVNVSACSPPIWEENFDYGGCDNSHIPNMTSNWTSFSGSSNNAQYRSNSLSYASYQASGIGGSFSFENGGSDDISRIFSSTGINSGNIYASFLININAAGSGEDFFVTLLGDPSNVSQNVRVFTIPSGSGYKLGVGKLVTTAGSNTTSVLNFGTTYLVILKYEFITGGVNDPFKLWVFSSGVPSTEATAGTPISVTSGADATNLKSFGLKQTNKPKGLLDGIRVATSWESLFCGSTTTQSATTYTWTGASSSSWSNAGNWSPAGVPRSIDNIIISTPGTNLLNITDCRSIKNFTLNGTGNFGISASGIFTIEGDVAYGGTATASLHCDSQVFIKSASSQLIPPLNYGNLDAMGGNRVFSPTGTIGICAGFNVDNTVHSYTVTGSTVNYFSSSTGWNMKSFTYNNLTFSGTGSFYLGNSAVATNKTITVLGNYLQSAGTVYVGNNNTATGTLNVDGNFTMTGGVLSVNTISGGTGIVNLKGNLSVGSTSRLYSYTSGASSTANFNFTGTTEQTIEIVPAPFGTTNLQFFVNSGATVKLINQDFSLGTNSTFEVKNGGTLDFGFNGNTALNVTSTGTGTGFESKSGSILKITSPDGLWGNNPTVVQTLGNVQVTKSNRTINTNGTFWYVGKSNQRTGDAPNTTLSTTSNTKKVIVDLSDNANTLSLDVAFGVSTTGELDIRKGRFVETVDNYVFGSDGLLKMETDTYYKIAKGNNAEVVIEDATGRYIPRMSGAYILNGGTIDLAGTGPDNGFQTLRGGRAYKNLTFSTGGLKTISTGTSTVDGLISVTESTILDVKNKTLGGTGTGLTMTGTAEYKTAGTDVKPDAGGTYTLGAGTKITFTSGSTTTPISTLQKIRLAPNYYNIDVVGNNVGTDTPTGAINIQSGGTFSVKPTGVFKLSNTTGFSGGSNTALLNEPIIDLQSGSTIEYAKAGDQTITIATGIVENTADTGDDNSNYSNLKLSGAGTKSFMGTDLKVGKNLDVEETSLLPVSGNQTLIVNNKIKTVDADAILSSSVAGDLSNISASTTKGILIQNNGSLVQIADVNLNDGKIQMERIAKPMFRYDYTYWSSPVESAFTLNNLSPKTLANKYFKWNHSATTPTWEVIQGGTLPMEAGRGYIVRAPQDFDIEGVGSPVAKEFNANFIGKPNNGTVSIGVTGSTVAGVTKWNLIGNPYPSAVDADLFLNLNADANAVLGGTLYFWTHNTNIASSGTMYSYNTADYASWNGVGGTETNEAGSDQDISTDNAPTGKIAAGQGFFIKGLASGNAIFNNTMRIPGENNQFFKNPAPIEKHRVWLNMKGTTKGFSQTLVGYVSNATNALDNRFDGETFGGNQVTFYSMLDTKALVIQGRAVPFMDTDTVPLGYKTTLTENISIGIDHFDGLFDNQGIYLEDNVLNVVHDLKASVYTFAAVPGTFNNRFVLRYLPEEVLANPTFDEQLHSVTIRKNESILRINSPYESIQTVTVYDIMGRLIFEQTNCNTNTFETSNLVQNQQALIVKVKLNNGGVVTKKVL